MATIDESTVYHRRTTHLQPLSPRVPTSTDRHLHQRDILNDVEHHTGSINRLLNSEQYRRSHARLIEYRQHSKIPGVALNSTITNNLNEMTSNGRNELILPLKEVFIETTRTKQQNKNQDEIDFVDDDSIFSHDPDRRRRAKHWIKEHQFFFTEYQ
jgi:hypothetical protein